jgi:hypothetical protein
LAAALNDSFGAISGSSNVRRGSQSGALGLSDFGRGTSRRTFLRLDVLQGKLIDDR